MRGVCLTHPVLYWFLCKEFLLHISYSLLYFFYSFFFFYLGSFFYTSRAGFFLFSGGGSLTYPMLDSFLSGESLLHIPCSLHFYLWSFSYTSHAVFTLLCGVFLTYPKLGFLVFLEKKFNLVSFSYVSRWLHFYLGSFSYTSRDGLTFIRRVPLTQPMLALVFCGRFLLHIPYWLFIFLYFFKTF